jgi:hypothetical protein
VTSRAYAYFSSPKLHTFIRGSRISRLETRRTSKLLNLQPVVKTPDPTYFSSVHRRNSPVVNISQILAVPYTLGPPRIHPTTLSPLNLTPLPIKERIPIFQCLCLASTILPMATNEWLIGTHSGLISVDGHKLFLSTTGPDHVSGTQS